LKKINSSKTGALQTIFYMRLKFI